MEIKAIVPFRGHIVEYLIGREEEGIYFAKLTQEEGTEIQPPAHIILTKGIRQWKASTDEQALTDELGMVIDIHLQSGIVFTNETKFSKEGPPQNCS